jgi:hypothetical protein
MQQIYPSISYDVSRSICFDLIVASFVKRSADVWLLLQLLISRFFCLLYEYVFRPYLATFEYIVCFKLLRCTVLIKNKILGYC